MGEFWAALPPTVQAVAGIVGLVAAVAIVWELGVSLVVGVIVAAMLNARGWSTGLALAVGAAATVLAYIVWCLLYPRTKCLRCAGRARDTDGAGNERRCWLCGGSGRRGRLGAKLLRRHRRFIGR